MTFWSDMDSEMQLLPLDTDTADRLLAGSVDAEDAPPGYGRVVRLLEAASSEASSEELAREPEAVAAMAAALRSPVHRNVASSRRSFMPFALSRPRLTAAVVAAAFAASVGMASAGSLPGAAQDVASEMLAKVGITVPGANDSAGTHPDVRGNSTSVPNVPIAPADAGKGAEISELATTTDLTGVEKGAAVSTAASGGKSQAGQHGSASGAGSASTTAAPVETPNSGGTGTADTASGGKSSTGTATANAASGGKSAAGSGNATGGQETADTASGGRSSTGQSHRP
jgi:hypothetical protein